MRHRTRGRKLGRKAAHRTAMKRNMASSLFSRAGTKREFIVTTLEKAKETQPFAERLITLAKRGDLHARRRVLALLPDKAIVKKLFGEIGPRFKDRAGGYTRILKYPKNRLGDNGRQAILGFVRASDSLPPRETTDVAPGKSPP